MILTLAQPPCVIAERELEVAVMLSIGVSVPVEDADSPDALIAVAARRLDAAKHAGRDRYCIEG